jgi:hypothetical protein
MRKKCVNEVKNSAIKVFPKQHSHQISKKIIFKPFQKPACGVAQKPALFHVEQNLLPQETTAAVFHVEHCRPGLNSTIPLAGKLIASTQDYLLATP